LTVQNICLVLLARVKAGSVRDPKSPTSPSFRHVVGSPCYIFSHLCSEKRTFHLFRRRRHRTRSGHSSCI